VTFRIEQLPNREPERFLPRNSQLRPRAVHSIFKLTMERITTLELCAGAGGQALGLEQAGIEHAALVEIDRHACTTLRCNRPKWNVIQQDIRNFDPTPYKGVDLVSGGLPCPPCSVAGKQGRRRIAL